MYAARVIGTVVCTQKEEKLSGLKLQVVQPVNLISLQEEGKPVVAIDAVGAGISEIVLVVGGSSARQTSITTNMPVDATIMAIVDYIDIEGKQVFNKFNKGEINHESSDR
ncbi:EutN/CcmL family microcompartment protein [Candidatus Clostridium stratigraminis]|uniref:EutN/CcmL family microcompartment protein n=1 Tax=Candidatus Clostridium stratigraminis TaxID=3381661 RepID=A0ABW8TAE7_9CLOT